MPHIFELNTSQATELSSPGLAAIRARVTLETDILPAISQTADGSINFGSNYVFTPIDVTSILRNDYIVIRSAIPPLPTKDGKANQQGGVTIQIDNTARYWGVLQNEGVIDGTNIQDSVVSIEATCGPMDPLPMYKGKVVEPPEEEEGKTTFRTKSILWDIIDVPLVLDRSESGPIKPVLFADEVLNYSSYSANNVDYYHGLGVWDQYGNLETSVENDAPEKVYIKRIDFHPDEDGEPVPLGKFTITFINYQECELTQPDGKVFRFSPYGDFSRGFVSIPETAWDFAQGVDPVGTKIEFWTYYTAKGNPWSLCKNLLYKALADAWGEAPAEPSTLPVDWDAFTAFETAFPQTIFFSETNKENKVFSPNEPAKPKRIKDVLQKILDHVGCQLTFTPEGKISLVSTLYVPGRLNLYTYTSSHLSGGTDRMAAHSIIPDGPKYDRMVIRYGLNSITDDYGAREVRVIATGTIDKFNTYEIAFDYFKIARSDRFVKRIARMLFSMVATANRRLKMELLPNWGLAIQPGDKFEVNFTTQPVLPNTRTNTGRYWMAYETGVKIGRTVEVRAIEIEEPIVGGKLCEDFILCETKLC